MVLTVRELSITCRYHEGDEKMADTSLLEQQPSSAGLI
jgi:hypothetical protein